MWKKIGGYSLISFFSFCFFTVLFHTMAGAQTSGAPLLPNPTPILLSPTPTAAPTASPTILPSATPMPTLTPLPTAVPAPTISVVADIESLFTKYSDMYHVDKETLKRVARCESGFNSQAANGPYAGMFQFMEQTWISARAAMGVDTKPALRTNAEEAIRTAAFMFGRGQGSAWSGCE